MTYDFLSKDDEAVKKGLKLLFMQGALPLGVDVDKALDVMSMARGESVSLLKKHEAQLKEDRAHNTKAMERVGSGDWPATLSFFSLFITGLATVGSALAGIYYGARDYTVVPFMASVAGLFVSIYAFDKTDAGKKHQEAMAEQQNLRRAHKLTKEHRKNEFLQHPTISLMAHFDQAVKSVNSLLSHAERLHAHTRYVGSLEETMKPGFANNQPGYFQALQSYRGAAQNLDQSRAAYKQVKRDSNQTFAAFRNAFTAYGENNCVDIMIAQEENSYNNQLPPLRSGSFRARSHLTLDPDAAA